MGCMFWYSDLTTKELLFDSCLIHSVHTDNLYRVQGTVFLRVTYVRYRVYNSPPSSILVRKVSHLTCTHIRGLTAWCLIM